MASPVSLGGLRDFMPHRQQLKYGDRDDDEEHHTEYRARLLSIQKHRRRHAAVTERGPSAPKNLYSRTLIADRGYDHDKYRRLVWTRGVKP
jgi:hypothetical protein